MSKYASLALLLVAVGFCAASFASESSTQPPADPGYAASRYRVNCRPQCAGCRRTPYSCPDNYPPKCGCFGRALRPLCQPTQRLKGLSKERSPEGETAKQAIPEATRLMRKLDKLRDDVRATVKELDTFKKELA